jgi:hypothetical protein
MSELRADTITASDGTSPVTLTKQSAAKAWVNFNGTGTIATRDSFNLSSLSDIGTGEYSVTIASAMSNTNYAVIGAVGRNANDGSMFSNPVGTTANTTTTQRVKGLYVDGGPIDMTQMCSSLLGDLS